MPALACSDTACSHPHSLQPHPQLYKETVTPFLLQHYLRVILSCDIKNPLPGRQLDHHMPTRCLSGSNYALLSQRHAHNLEHQPAPCLVPVEKLVEHQPYCVSLNPDIQGLPPSNLFALARVLPCHQLQACCSSVGNHMTPLITNRATHHHAWPCWRWQTPAAPPPGSASACGAPPLSPERQQSSKTWRCALLLLLLSCCLHVPCPARPVPRHVRRRLWETAWLSVLCWVLCQCAAVGASAAEVP